MSIPVALVALAERIDEYGPVAYLITAGPDGVPHVVSVRVVWDEQDLVVGAGRRTTENVEQRPQVTLLWPALPGTGYSLIVDGPARPRHPDSLAVAPTAAVLHRLPDGDPSSPSCIPVLPPPS